MSTVFKRSSVHRGAYAMSQALLVHQRTSLYRAQRSVNQNSPDGRTLWRGRSPPQASPSWEDSLSTNVETCKSYVEVFAPSQRLSRKSVWISGWSVVWWFCVAVLLWGVSADEAVRGRLPTNSLPWWESLHSCEGSCLDGVRSLEPPAGELFRTHQSVGR